MADEFEGDPQLVADNTDEESDGDCEDTNDDELLEKIRTLKQTLEENPFLYDNHVELIGNLRQTGDLDAVRKARERMYELFPLTEELWLQWIRDELMLSGIQEALENIKALFEKAVDDYIAPGVWVLYCQFAVDKMDKFEEGIDFPREVFERAIKSCGLHVTKGSLIWDAYREFELACLSALQQQETSDGANESLRTAIQEQYDRVDAIFRRQLSVPLIGMESTLEEYRDWNTEQVVTVETVPNYSFALEKLKELTKYEDALSESTLPPLEAFKEYISYEKKGKNLSRTSCVYQRALAYHPLDVGLWIEYTKYMDNTCKVVDTVLGSHFQSIRNCPWSVDLWLLYCRSQERLNCSHEEIIAIFEKSLTGNFVNSGDYLKMWMAYLVYMRERVLDWKKGESPDVKELKEVMNRAKEHMKENFGEEADSEGVLTRFEAHVEGRCLGNMQYARELWEELIYWHSGEVEYWLQYAQLEGHHGLHLSSCRHHGNKDKCRSVFKRAVNSVQDNPELLFSNFLFFERTEGSLDTLLTAGDRVRERRSQIRRLEKKYLQKEQDRARVAEGRRPRSGEEKERKKGSAERRKKRQYTEFLEEDKEGSVAMETNNSASESLPKRSKYQEKTNSDPPPSDNQLQAPHPEAEGNIPNQSPPDTSTVFVSNLPLATKSSELQDLFGECGSIADIRIVKSRKELSKKPFGYAYIQFHSKESVTKALSMDRTSFYGRQMYVSPYDEKKKVKVQPEAQRYPNTKDKKTVFVSNLPFSMTEDEIRELFCKCGTVKQVRLPFKRQRKGIAYVEYEEETAAEEAVKQLHQSDVRGRMITVAISNPPKKKGDAVAMETTSTSQQRTLMPPPRMIPTSVATARRQKIQVESSTTKKQTPEQKPTSGRNDPPPQEVEGNRGSEGTEESKEKLSNKDFRKMFGV